MDSFRLEQLLVPLNPAIFELLKKATTVNMSASNPPDIVTTTDDIPLPRQQMAASKHHQPAKQNTDSQCLSIANFANTRT